MLSLISNPPYNMKWKLPPFAQLQTRFNSCELPPESNANYAFILTGLDKIDGKAAFLLPCNILCDGLEAEISIRKYLVDKNYVESVILCPDKMFEDTSIATCILILSKNKETTDVMMLDMRQKYETEVREQNGQFGAKSHTNRTYKKEVKVFSDAIMADAISCITEKKDIPGYSKCVSTERIKQDGYTLSASYYIGFAERENIHRPYADIVADINRITAEKNACKLTINETLAKIFGFDISLYRKCQQESGLNELLKQLGAEPLAKQDYFSTSKHKNEIKFENNSKDIISSVLMMILNTWKQHIFYLTNEENRYLAELRDALLPELMSGKIDVSKLGSGN